MNDELRELYQEIILDHNKNPKNYKIVANTTHQSDGYNPLCGDKISLTLEVENNCIKDVGFQGSGCAISKASASVMTSVIKGKSIADADKIFKEFEAMIKSNIKEEVDYAKVGKLGAFAGVREFPARVKCAALAWRAMEAALHENERVVSTE